MNHYERLKISPDAPPEVIRAAYRALAAKLHPDRQGGAATGPDDAMHTQMAALNSAYEVLIDPKLRKDYDATLAPANVQMAGQTAQRSQPPQTDASPEDGPDRGPSTRVDMDWFVPSVASPRRLWPPSRRVAIVGGGGGALVLLALAGWFWQEASQRQMERALSDQYASRPADERARQQSELVGEGAQPASRPGRLRSAEEIEADTMASRRRPTVDELARMSDEELLRILPTLDGDGSAAGAAAATQVRRMQSARVHHPLDGRPLNLRSDRQLIDPLAPEPQVSVQPGSAAAAVPKP